MSEADELCGRIAFLAEGKIVALDTPRALKLGLGGGAPAVDVVLDDGSDLRLALGEPATPRAARARRARSACARVHSREPTLADVFIQLTGRSLVDDTTGARGMSPRRILAILTKDLRDAWRDGRILVLLALPIGMAVFYTRDRRRGEAAETSVAVVDPAGGRSRASCARRRQEREARARAAPDAAAARKLVADEEVDARRRRRARSPAARARSPRRPGRFAGGAVDRRARARRPGAGGRREPPARTAGRGRRAADQKPSTSSAAHARRLFVDPRLFVIFVAMMVVPMQTAEELETGTFGALRLAATGRRSSPPRRSRATSTAPRASRLTVVLTGLDVNDPLLFFGATLALIVTLVAFGMLLGLLLPNTSAINTYAGFLIVPWSS